MKIDKYSVDIYKLKAICRDCDAEMERQKEILLTAPPQYRYICPKCGKEETSIECYPKIVIE